MQDGWLNFGIPGTAPILCDTPDWFAWLEAHDTFACVGTNGTFTVRKEQRADGQYWRAYRRIGGKLYRHYLGRTSSVTQESLGQAALHLADQPAPAPVSAHTPDPAPVPAISQFASLRTHLVRPEVRPNRVQRLRLLDHLRGSPRRHVLIYAPAGYGKSTLVADWVATDRRNAAWVMLGAEDNLPERFWPIFLLALDQIQPGCVTSLLEVLSSAQQTPLPALLAGEIVAATYAIRPDRQGRPALLVLDDFHLISNPTIHTTLEILLERASPTFRMVFTSRVESQLRLSRLRVLDLLLELRAEEMAFTSGEVISFVQTTVHAQITSSEAERLVERTEGWVAMLQLATLAAGQAPDAHRILDALRGDEHLITAYLVEELLATQPAIIQRFLLTTCVLQRMCAPLCAALLAEAGDLPVTGSEALVGLQPEQMLIYLLQTNQLVSRLEDRIWYRYHALLAEGLLARLRYLAPDHERRLRRAAAAWYEIHGQPEEALGQAISAQDWDSATRLVCVLAEDAWGHGNGQLIEHWLSQLPHPVIQASPQLSIELAWSQLNRWQFTDLPPLLDRIAGQLGMINLPQESADLLRARMLLIQATMARMVTHQYDQAIELARQALALLPEHTGIWHVYVALEIGRNLIESDKSRTAEALNYYHMALGYSRELHRLAAMIDTSFRIIQIQMDIGNLDAAVAAAQQAQQLAKTWGYTDSPLLGLIDIAPGMVYYHRNELDRAAEMLERGVEHARRVMQPMGLFFGLAWLQLQQLACGDLPRARQIVELTRQLYVDTGLPYLRELGDMFEARVFLAQGDHQQAARWPLAAIEALEAGKMLFPVTEPLWNEVGQILIQVGEPAAALRAMERFRIEVERRGQLVYLCKLQTIAALARMQLEGYTPAMIAELDAALALAHSMGRVRVFLDLGAPMADLLKIWQRANPGHALQSFVAGVLAAFDGGAPANPLDLLSMREREVLELVAAGYTNKQIAARLMIANDTVGFHLRTIYQKLGVSSRTQAIAKTESRKQKAESRK